MLMGEIDDLLQFESKQETIVSNNSSTKSDIKKRAKTTIKGLYYKVLKIEKALIMNALCDIL